MMEEFFDLRIATVSDGDSAPPEAHLVRIMEPSRAQVAAKTREGWFYKPCYVTYVILVPRSIDEYLESTFRSKARANVKRLLREVPKRYRLSIDEEGKAARLFEMLYRRTVVDRPRGKDRLGEHEHDLIREWLGFHLYEGETMVAGLLVNKMHRHLSVAYGAFDPVHRRRFDLEHFLILQVLKRSIEERHATLSLGVDTNRYGHHLSLGLAPYKLRIGFTPAPYEPGGRELLKIQRFDIFEKGLFFYSYASEGLKGHLFSRGDSSLRPFQHRSAPPMVRHPLPD